MYKKQQNIKEEVTIIDGFNVEMSDTDAIELLERFSDYFSQNNIFVSMLNTLLWGIMWVLHWIVSF